MASPLPTIEKVIEACYRFDVPFLIANKAVIQQYLQLGVTHRSKCYMPGCGCVIRTSILDVFTNNITDDNPDHVNNLKTIKFLIESGTINPNELIDGKLILNECLENYCGWKIDRERVEILLKYTSPEVIKNYRTTINGTVLHSLLTCHAISDDCFDYFFEKIIATGIDINVIVHYDDKDDDDESNKYNLLHLVAMRTYKNLVKFALDAGQNPNLFIDSKSFYLQNTAMLLLNNRCDYKDQRYINDTVTVIIMLIEGGLNKDYTDKDGRNLMDYVEDFCWGNVMIGSSTFKDILIGMGCPEKTGIPSTNKMDKNTPPPQESTQPANLLYEYRFEKDPSKLQFVFDELIRLKEEGEDFSTKIKFDERFECKTVYEYYCRNRFWSYTTVADFLKQEGGYEW